MFVLALTGTSSSAAAAAARAATTGDTSGLSSARRDFLQYTMSLIRASAHEHADGYPGWLLLINTHVYVM